MTQEKIDKFFRVAISKTKYGILHWTRVSGTNELKDVVRMDRERSFISAYGTGKILLFAERQTNDISCYLSPTTGLKYQQFGDDNDPMLLRLYNVVYSLFPSVDAFIDSFISDFEDSNDPEENHQ